MHLIKYLLVIIHIVVCVNLAPMNGASCRGKTTCKSIRNCAPVMSLIASLHKPLKQSVVQFLRAQQCGFADGYPKICCGVLPRNLKIFNQHRDKTTSRRQKVLNQSKQQQQQHQHQEQQQIRDKYKHQQQQQQHEVQVDRTPSAQVIASTVNKLSIYNPEPNNFAASFDITVSTAPPGASTVPYLQNLQRDEPIRNFDLGFFNAGERFHQAAVDYMDEYELPRRRRAQMKTRFSSDSDINSDKIDQKLSGDQNSDADLDIEVR